MAITVWQANVEYHVGPARAAARNGKTGDALEAIVSMLGMLLDAANRITRNQYELEQAISKLASQKNTRITGL